MKSAAELMELADSYTTDHRNKYLMSLVEPAQDCPFLDTCQVFTN